LGSRPVGPGGWRETEAASVRPASEGL
jgi:hypothetical protein